MGNKIFASLVISASLFAAGGLIHAVFDAEHIPGEIEVIEVTETTEDIGVCVQYKPDDIIEYDAVVFEAAPLQNGFEYNNANFITVSPHYKAE